MTGLIGDDRPHGVAAQVWGLIAMDGSGRSSIRFLEERRQEILGVVRSHRGKEVHVFGSVVRGDDGPDSDIDFLVTLEKEGSLFDLIRIRSALAELLGREVDVISMDGLLRELDGRSPSRRENILGEAVPL